MWALNQLRPVYQNVRVLAAATGLPVLGAVSRTWLHEQKIAARKSMLRFAGAASLLAILCGMFIVGSDAAVGFYQRLVAGT